MLLINVDIVSNGLEILYWIMLQFLQIRNSSLFVQQSAKFICKRLLQNKLRESLSAGDRQGYW